VSAAAIDLVLQDPARGTGGVVWGARELDFYATREDGAWIFYVDDDEQFRVSGSTVWVAARRLAERLGLGDVDVRLVREYRNGQTVRRSLQA
jgi:hypothetical protein